MHQKFFNLDIPIIQAPMAGGITTPELVTAVSNAGALGSLGAGYMAPDEMRKVIQKIRSLTQKPFNVNLFIPEHNKSDCNLSSMKEFLMPLWRELTNEPFESTTPPSFDEQMQIVLDEQVPIFSFTFGLLPLSWIERLKRNGTFILGTATTPEEAQQLATSGVDAIVCQGQEAGGHRGNFSSYDPLYSLSTLLMLTREKVKIPLIAAGGIMNGDAAAATFRLGASAAQIGTAFLTTEESGTNPIYRQVLLTHPHQSTAITNVFTGKPARAIRNSLMRTLEGHLIPPYPDQHYLTSPLRSLAAQKKRPDLMSLWAGQGYPLCRSIPATELIRWIAKNLR